MRRNTQSNTRIRSRTPTHMCTQVQARPHTRTSWHTHRHTRRDTDTHTYTQIYAYTHSHTHTATEQTQLLWYMARARRTARRPNIIICLSKCTRIVCTRRGASPARPRSYEVAYINIYLKECFVTNFPKQIHLKPVEGWQSTRCPRREGSSACMWLAWGLDKHKESSEVGSRSASDYAEEASANATTASLGHTSTCTSHDCAPNLWKSSTDCSEAYVKVLR